MYLKFHVINIECRILAPLCSLQFSFRVFKAFIQHAIITHISNGNRTNIILTYDVCRCNNKTVMMLRERVMRCTIWIYSEVLLLNPIDRFSFIHSFITVGYCQRSWHTMRRKFKERQVFSIERLTNGEERRYPSEYPTATDCKVHCESYSIYTLQLASEWSIEMKLSHLNSCC